MTRMRFFVLFSVICLSVSTEFDSYQDFLVFAAKNHYNSVSEYAKDIGVTQLDTEWEQFKVKFGRKYGTEEEEKRKLNFLKTIKFIESHNNRYKRGDVSHEVDVNQFADWTQNEFKSTLNSKPVTIDSNYMNNYQDTVVNLTLPDIFDWRHQEKVTSIKNQGECGSCWAFATIATIESAFLIKHNKSLNLSEQQLIDCCNPNHDFKHMCWGCGGALINEAFKYVIDNGLEYGNDYKYAARDQKCRDTSDKQHIKIKGFKQLAHPATDEEVMQAIYKNGPVAVFIDADGTDFRYLSKGILRSQGHMSADHYVTAIGWGPDYWIIKNSWGTSWGEQGFGRIAKGENLRGFNNYVYYPVL